MDFLGDLLETIFDVFSRRVAIAIMAALGGVAAIAGFVARSHYLPQHHACNTATGGLIQAINANASIDCGLARDMAIGGLIVGVAGILLAAAMIVWLLVMRSEWEPRAATWVVGARLSEGQRMNLASPIGEHRYVYRNGGRWSAGWSPVPESKAELRWYDGEEYTSDRRPATVQTDDYSRANAPDQSGRPLEAAQ